MPISIPLALDGSWQSAKVLVTGAGGFIGSHLVEALVSLGAQVRAFVHYNSRNDPGFLTLLPEETLGQVDIVLGDLRDSPAVGQAVAGCDTVFHLGALISIPYSYQNPTAVAETNLMGTLNILQACREAGAQRVVHTSSSEVYGSALAVPIDEDHPLQGQSPYSASKIGADKLAESFHCAYDLPVVTVRPFNTYGPRQSDRAVMPTIIAQALVQDVVYLGNLETRRDLTYVSDIVEGFLRSAQTPGVEGDTFNLGTGTEIRIKDLARNIIAIIGRPVDILVDPARLRPEKSEVQRLCADSSRAGERLGWVPEVSLQEGLRHTIDWVAENLHRYRIGVYQV
ncbi:MAG: SDR family NAD(P)-dependent oxidoreductase [Anaerolineales bacterium]